MRPGSYRIAALCVQAAVWALTGSARAEAVIDVPGVIDVRTRVDRDQPFLHEQLVLELTVVHHLYARPRWEPPVCEGFWVERMPSEGSALLHPGGRDAARTTLFRRALYATRTGTLEVPSSILRVKTRDGDEAEIDVPGVRVRVRALPEAGRPEGFDGLVGPLEVRVSADGDQVTVGRAIGVDVDVFGAGNVWDVSPPDLAALIGRDVEVFAERPRTLTDTRKGRLVSRRRFRFDVVPQETGTHTIGAFRVDYFDPAAGRYRRASSEPLALEVVRRGAVQRAPWEARERAGEVSLRPGLAWPIGLVLVGLLTVSGWALARWWRGAPRGRAREPEPDLAGLLARAEQAAGSPDFPSLLSAAVKAGVRVRWSLDPSPLTTSELAERIDDAEALRILRAADAARFAGDAADPKPLLLAARRYLEVGRAGRRG
ncbi:MAG: BatD family protein [Deltaproteobacteria bacterium]|nr:BatD family protein [Deltaproteobacteria bacterium]MBW2412940.1 BatD family protein [Deltaproteobacteria bacterium]